MRIQCRVALDSAAGCFPSTRALLCTTPHSPSRKYCIACLDLPQLRDAVSQSKTEHLMLVRRYPCSMTFICFGTCCDIGHGKATCSFVPLEYLCCVGSWPLPSAAARSMTFFLAYFPVSCLPLRGSVHDRCICFLAKVEAPARRRSISESTCHNVYL